MATVERKLYVSAQLSIYSKEPTYLYWDADMTNYGYPTIAIINISFEKPTEVSLIATTVSKLKREIENERANCAEKIKKIEEQIQSLLALPAPK